MTEESLEQVLRAFTDRRPFLPFVIEFVSGDRVWVSHPEAVVLRNHLFIHRNPAGEFRVFQSDGVCQVLDASP